MTPGALRRERKVNFSATSVDAGIYGFIANIGMSLAAGGGW
jgi:hypothetical protein